MDAEEICRTCLDSVNVMVSLFQGEKPSEIVNMLGSLYGIQVSYGDGLPLQMCTICIDQLQRAHSFKLKCKKSENTLLKLKEAKLLLIGLKKELVEETEPNAGNFQDDEIISIKDDDDDDDDNQHEHDPQHAASYDDEFPLSEPYEAQAGFDMDEEMIEKMDIIEPATNEDSNDESDETFVTTNRMEFRKFARIITSRFDSPTHKAFQMNYIEKELKCSGCSEVFKKLEQLRAHVMEKHTKGELCYLCDSVSGVQVSDIWKHSINHLPKRYACVVCGKQFTKRAYLRAHSKLTHSGFRREIFQCKLCAKTFKTRSGISYHRQVAHAVEKPFACEICSARFPHIKLLRLHMLSNHTDGPPTCKFCGKRFNAYSTMMKHIRILHRNGHKQNPGSNRAISFKCAICSQTFDEKQTLESHVVNTHTNVRQHKCSHCPFAFKFKSVMAIHISNQHPHAKLEAIATNCEICSRKFRTLKSLESHISNVHTNTRTYLCIYCSYTFKIESNLEAHITAIHSNRVGPIEYKCDECESQFGSSDEVLEHKGMVHNNYNLQPDGGGCDATDFIFRTMFE